jgi:tRNA1(Val) A37 N6-methylase TrmN6
MTPPVPLSDRSRIESRAIDDVMREPSFSVDEILGGRLALKQPRQGERISIDAVFAAAAVRAKPGETVLDAGSGSGAIALCVAHRIPGVKVTGIEVDRSLVDLANDNARENGLSDAVFFACADITALTTDSGGAYDHVVTNPPFYRAGRGRVSPNPAKAQAHAEQRVGLSDWLACSQRQLRSGGRITVIFPAERLDELLHELGREAGNICVLPLWPKTGKAAKRVIVQGTRGSNAPVRLLSGMVLHGDDGHYTPTAEMILRGGDALTLPR